MGGSLRGGLIGCGYFAQNHLNAWKDVTGAEMVAVCDTDGDRARAAGDLYGIDRVYRDAAEMLAAESLDFVDVVTQAPSHREIVVLVAQHGVSVICQKPFAPAMDDARAMVVACKLAGVQLMVHENFRWQRPIRELKVASQNIGDIFFGRIVFRTNHDIFTNQPYLFTDDRFIMYDLGVHLLDLARFFMGDVRTLYCRTQSVNPAVLGEDSATLLLEMEGRATCTVEACYFSHLNEDVFPQTLIRLEGSRGSADLDVGYQLTTVSDGKVTRESVAPHPPSWSYAPVESVQESVVAIQQHWVDCLAEGYDPETTGLDNLKTLELVFGAYESAESGMPYKTDLALGT